MRSTRSPTDTQPDPVPLQKPPAGSLPNFGAGLPTRPNVHQVAQAVDPGASVVYIDNDPMVCAHGRLVLEENLLTTAVIEADIRKLDTTLGGRAGRRSAG